MKQQLENMVGETRPMNIKQQTYFVVGDLEYLSAGALYSNDFSKLNPSMFESINKNSFRDKPSSNFGNDNPYKPVNIEPPPIVFQEFEPIKIEPAQIVLPKVEPMNIGTFSEFKGTKKTPGMIETKIDVSTYFLEAKGINLQERYDVTGHNGKPFHLNQDLIQKNDNRFKPKQNLGDAHLIDLELGNFLKKD